MSAPTQQDAVRVLGTLVAATALPRLYWTIPSYPGGKLTGQAYASRDDATRAAVQAWAEYLNAPVVETDRDTYTEVTVSSALDGVRVEVFAYLDVKGGAA